MSNARERASIPSAQTNADGALKEWTTPLLEDNYAHRHASHLYALFGGPIEEIATNAPLRQAFQRAIEKRMDFRRHEPSGEMAFGAVQLGLAAGKARGPGIRTGRRQFPCPCFHWTARSP